jgi:hypothetical protein
MQGKILAYRKSKYYKHTQEKLNIKLYPQKYAKKKNFTSKNIFMYNPQRDKCLNTSKKEVKNGGTSS